MKVRNTFFLALAGFTTISNAQVVLGDRGASEFYPNLVETVNDQVVQGMFSSDGLHYSVDATLEARSILGLGYGIQGYIQYFRVGSAPVFASGIEMTWIGDHTMLFDSEPSIEDTPVSMDVRLVKYDDANNNGEWNAGEQQWDLSPQLLITSLIRNSDTISVADSRVFADPILLDPDSSYFFGGSVTFNIDHQSSGGFIYNHEGTQTFDIDFAPVPEPHFLTFVFASLAGTALKRRNIR